MSSVASVQAASNAVPAPIVSTPVLTNEAFERWLDAAPDRRKHYQHDTPKGQQQVRERVARMFALRSCPASRSFARCLYLAQQLAQELETARALSTHAQTAQVLKVAGLRVPKETDVCQAWGADCYDEARLIAKEVRPGLKQLIEYLERIRFILPDVVPESPVPPQAEAAPEDRPDLISTPAEIAAAEGVTADSCVKAAWAVTELVASAAADLEAFCDLFKPFADDEQLGPVFRDAAGTLWAMDQFIGLQPGQLPYWSSTGAVLKPQGASC